MKKLKSVLCLTLLAGLISLIILPSAAWAQTPYTGRFTLTQPCNGTTSISGKNPIPLETSIPYEAVGLNKQDNPTYVYIKIPNSTNHWVALTCGELNPALATSTESNPSETGTTTGESGSQPTAFIPFFDDNSDGLFNRQHQDITPIPRALNDFDLAIVELCGQPGKVVSENEFKSTLNNFPGVLANIKEYVGGSLEEGRTSDDEFLDDLTDVWFKVKGFDHVFCGEPGRGIGGLHFAGRYLDLQQKNLAGILPRSIPNAEIQEGAVYTLGVELQLGDRKVSAPIKGYAYTLDAEEILELGARTYKDNPNTDSTNIACLVGITDEGQTFENVFVAREGAIRTFYSDASPDFGRTGECNVDNYETPT
uniref:Bacterial EndoU nuclease domain-containing protein n=2 Tax=Gloeothece TaxID=28070 RepID=E0UCK0_GLOV7|nr:conserved hypothetical protein [Gloeothece verrucosa PCC 7822]